MDVCDYFVCVFYLSDLLYNDYDGDRKFTLTTLTSNGVVSTLPKFLLCNIFNSNIYYISACYLLMIRKFVLMTRMQSNNDSCLMFVYECDELQQRILVCGSICSVCFRIIIIF